MPSAQVSRDCTIRIGEPTPRSSLSPHMFGLFFEHWAKILYEGIWDLERNTLRSDVLAATRALRPTILRYPGGLYANSYHWRDGVGPREQRPTHPARDWKLYTALPGISEDIARRFVRPEPNAFGTDEYLSYCDDLGARPALTVNVATGTPEEAADWVAYTKGRVKHWFIGNELYLPESPWNVHQFSPEEYAETFGTFATAMRKVDPELTLIAVGCLPRDGAALGFEDWSPRVMKSAESQIDMLSLHFYFPGFIGRPLEHSEADYLQLATAGDRFEGELDRLSASIGEEVPLSIDEWSLWSEMPQLLETNHSLTDAAFFASMFNSFIRRSGTIKLAMLSQFVNCLGPIQTRGDRMFTTAAYLVALLYREHSGSQVLHVETESERFHVPSFDKAEKTDTLQQVFDDSETASVTPLRDDPLESSRIDAVATLQGDEVALFLSNRSLHAPATIEVDGVAESGRLRWLDGDGPFTRNDVSNPWRLHIAERAVTTSSFDLPPHSVGVLLTSRSR